MRKTSASCLMLGVFIALMSGCSSSGDSNSTSTTPPPPAGTAEGLWNGATSTGRTIAGLVLDDGTYWVLYSVVGDPSVVAGLVQGTSTSQNGSFTSSDAKDFNLEGAGVLNATLAGNYVEKQTLNGTIVVPQLGQQPTFTNTYDTDYDLTPDANAVAGTYSGLAANNESVTVTLTSTGGISGSSAGGCNFIGSFTPRASGNVFDVVVTFGGGVCVNGTDTVNGVAFFDTATKTLYSAALNSTRTNGFIFIGTKP